MPKITKVKIDDLVAASRTYADSQVKKADVNKNGYLSKGEAVRLAKDLQDNFADSQFKLSTGSVKPQDLVREFTVLVEAWAKASDTNRDGYISLTETKRLPKNLRDNVINYIDAQQRTVAGTSEWTTRDLTPAGRAAEHEAEFGKHAVSYQAAFAKALEAVATDGDAGLPAFVREFGGPDGNGLTDPAKIKAEVKELLANGSVELVPTDEEISTGEATKDAWIFSFSTDGQGDHGLWAIVDRKTGETSVTNFN